jgi:Mce-associated membrane protein
MTTDTAIADIENVEETDAEVSASRAENHEPHEESPTRWARVRGGLGVGRRIHRLSTLSRRSTIATLVVLGLLLSAATATTIVFALSAADHNATAAATRAACDSAQSRVPKVLSYDFNTIDKDFPAAAGNLTGKFRDDFGQLGSSVIIPAAHRDSIITKATVVGSSVVTADAGKVTLLLFVNQETTSSKYQGPRLDGSRVRVTMTDSAGTWLISDITPV